MNKTVLIAIVLMFALTACETKVIMPQGEQQNAISVQGSTEFNAYPDTAKINFAIETQSQTAQEAQAKNRETSNTVVTALKKAGVKDDEIQTTNYRVEKIQEWDQNSGKIVDKGYRTSNTFVVMTKELELVGKLLDVGVQAGANRVESISFELSEKKQKEVKTEALRKATANAKEKAEALADGAGVRLGKLLLLSESSYAVMPYRRYDMMAKAETAQAEPTQISPQDVQVSAQVSAAYEIS